MKAVLLKILIITHFVRFTKSPVHRFLTIYTSRLITTVKCTSVEILRQTLLITYSGATTYFGPMQPQC